MTDVIIDTNVAVIANDQDPDVVESCIDVCKLFLISVMHDKIVLLDEEGEILSEYLGAISRDKPHGLGARFLFNLLQQQYNAERFCRTPLPKGANGEFLDFPNDQQLAGFDPSDRKFAALARNKNTPVTNATDSDWANFRTPLHANGIQVNFLCGCDPDAWFGDNS